MDKTLAAPKTLMDAMRYFSDLDRCQDLLASARWPRGIVCPTCGHRDVRYIRTRRVWVCKGEKHPRQQFSVKVGTIFEDSPLGLDKWFTAMWMICNAKNGVSSHEIGRALGITQKSAWFMLHRLRAAMRTGSYEKMRGRVEADETFIGGAARFMHKDRRDKKRDSGTMGGSAGKTAVMGLLERHGPDKASVVRAFVVPNVRKGALTEKISVNVEPGSEILTDKLPSYDSIGDEYTHNVVDHAEQYVRGHVHTNGLENFWSLLKRAIKGTYVAVEPFHLFRYVDEEVFRYNKRKGDDGQRFVLALGNAIGQRLTYKDLTGKTLGLNPA